MGEYYICGEETDKGKKNFALGEWIYLCSRACDDEYDPYRAESFDAEGDSEAYVVWKLKGKLPDRDWEVIEVFNDREDAVNASKNYSYGVFEELIGMEEDDERGAEGFRDAESFDADWDNAPYGSWDEAWSDEISFPMVEKPERLWLKNLSVIAVFAGAIWVGKQTRK